MKGVIDILSDYNLRQTDCRRAVLEAFLRKDFALSHADIEEAANGFDRVTLYRTLTTFVESGILHKVLDDSGIAKYALCLHQHPIGHQHSDHHIHFKCETCGQTSCIEEIDIPPVQLPKGYLVQDMNLLLQGVCNRCNTQA